MGRAEGVQRRAGRADGG